MKNITSQFSGHYHEYNSNGSNVSYYWDKILCGILLNLWYIVHVGFSCARHTGWKAKVMHIILQRVHTYIFVRAQNCHLTIKNILSGETDESLFDCLRQVSF